MPKDCRAHRPPPANPRQSHPGQTASGSPSFDPELYKARHLIENFFRKLKQFRAIATRYDKTARNFLAAIHLAAAIRDPVTHVAGNRVVDHQVLKQPSPVNAGPSESGSPL